MRRNVLSLKEFEIRVQVSYRATQNVIEGGNVAPFKM